MKISDKLKIQIDKKAKEVSKFIEEDSYWLVPTFRYENEAYKFYTIKDPQKTVKIKVCKKTHKAFYDRKRKIRREFSIEEIINLAFDYQGIRFIANNIIFEMTDAKNGKILAEFSEAVDPVTEAIKRGFNLKDTSKIWLKVLEKE